MSAKAQPRASWFRTINRDTLALAALLALQGFCLATLLGDAASEFAPLPFSPPETADAAGEGPADWDDRFELFVAVALTFGFLYTARRIWALLHRNQRVEAQLQAASGAFRELLEARFDRWALTPSERDVALLAIKGLSLAEIAALRESREGTVKAQCSAVYRKAGVSGRPQLLSLFIEDLLAEPVADAAAAAQQARCG